MPAHRVFPAPERQSITPHAACWLAILLAALPVSHALAQDRGSEIEVSSGTLIPVEARSGSVFLVCSPGLLTGDAA
jgi:hypothetical protein